MQGVLLDTSAAPPSTHWAILALGALTVIYIAFVRPHQKGKKKDPLARGPSDAALAQQRAVERDMTALLVEYEQVIRTMSAQLETRVAKLDVLLREADEKIAALRAASHAGTAGATDRPAFLPGSLSFGSPSFGSPFVSRAARMPRRISARRPLASNAGSADHTSAPAGRPAWVGVRA